MGGSYQQANNEMSQEYHVGWTKEDVEIWQTRKMPASKIHMRYQHHIKECALMVRLSQIDLPAGDGKFTIEALTR